MSLSNSHAVTLIPNLFDGEPQDVPFGPGAVILGGFARPFERPLVLALQLVVEAAPFRHMLTPNGRRMSVAMTNCGAVGWVSDRAGYRYDPCDPESGRPWPSMPAPFSELAARAAARAGFDGFAPDACLVNRYEPGARLSLHQDRDERDFEAPIVSVSLGLPAEGVGLLIAVDTIPDMFNTLANVTGHMSSTTVIARSGDSDALGERAT